MEIIAWCRFQGSKIGSFAKIHTAGWWYKSHIMTFCISLDLERSLSKRGNRFGYISFIVILVSVIETGVIDLLPAF